VFALTERFFVGQRIEGDIRRSVDFAIEEVFTNWVKYRPGAKEPIEVSLSVEDEAVRIELIDRDGEPFDLTQVPDADVNAPLEERKPGGLGMHLVRRLMDRFEFEHHDGTSTVIMTKRLR
jgi:anti-sigma regulatory factor (Ser/Thr protein kinase)